MSIFDKSLARTLMLCLAMATACPPLSAQENGQDPTTETDEQPKTFRVLAISNSFVLLPSLYFSAWWEALQLDNFEIGLLYYPSCSLEQYARDITTGNPTYGYFFFDPASASYKAWNLRKDIEITPNANATNVFFNSVEDGLKHADWDVVTLQQWSWLSGDITTMDPYIDKLKTYIQNTCNNKDVKVGWNMTWSLERGDVLDRYGGTDVSMYKAICNCVETLTERYSLSPIIPGGTVIQNLRTVSDSYWGKDKNQLKGYVFGGFTKDTDGQHLTDFGDFMICGTWAHYIALQQGKTIEGTHPQWPGFTDDEIQMGIQAILKAFDDWKQPSEMDETIRKDPSSSP